MANQLTADHDQVDKISNLPDDILYHILSFLSTKQAISTSVLSTRWRYLFASVPNLNLDETPLFSLPECNRYATIMNFWNFVDKVLLIRSTTNLEELRLVITKYTSRVSSWISVAATLRSVRQLDLCIFDSPQRDIKLPDTLFTCKTLVVLKLNVHILYVPSKVCLPNLKTLHLDHSGFLNDSIQSLISGCNILEDLFISSFRLNISQFNISHPFLKQLKIGYGQLSDNTRIVIDAPNLLYLKNYAKIGTGYFLCNLHSLVKANITLFEDRNRELTSEILSRNEFFRGITNVKSLVLSKDALRLLLHQEPIPLFYELVELKIDNCFRHEEKGILDLLQSMPNLEKLSFPYEVFGKLSENVPSCLLLHLKTIEISSFYQLDQLENFKYFLKNASALEKLTIHASCNDKNRRLKIAEELLAFDQENQRNAVSWVSRLSTDRHFGLKSSITAVSSTS